MTEKEKSKKEIGDMAVIIAATMPKIESIVQDCFRQLYDQSMQYRFLGTRFTFSNNKAFYEEIIESLLNMSDMSDKAIRSAVQEAISKIEYGEQEDIDDDLILTRIDSYGTSFKDIAEGFIIAAIVGNAHFIDMWQQFKIYKDTPLLAPMVAKVPEAVEIISKAISGKGSGNYISIFSNMLRELKSVVATYFAKAKIGVMGRGGFEWYKCFRNSNYDCPICDDVCAVPHKMTEIVLPVHPNCVCGMYPINSLEEF